MTLADYILSKSTLPSGTILDHILAMQTGGGQGTVFASMYSVSVEQQSVVVMRLKKPKIQDMALENHSRKQSSTRTHAKELSVHTKIPKLTSLLHQDEITVYTRSNVVMLKAKHK